jgi:hypothetical protein
MKRQVNTNKKGLQPIKVTAEARDGITLPTFSVMKLAGRTPLDDLTTDLMLFPKLYRLRVPAVLHLRDKNTATLLKGMFKEEFTGRQGTSHLLKVPLANSAGEQNRYIMLVGNGQASTYSGQTACHNFEAFIRMALELGVEIATVPFIPNPSTQGVLTQRVTAFKLKSVVAKVYAELTEQPRLKDIQIYCHPAAAASIEQGLKIEHKSNHSGDGCCCVHS